MATPGISIIVPCYNQAQYLDDCLRSVYQQTYTDWECIIVNDGSTDQTEAVANGWLDKDPRFVYLHTPNQGLSNTRNTGIKHASGEFILPLDADDKIDPRYIQEALSLFSNQPTLTLVYCLAHKFGAEDASWDLPEFSLPALATQNIIFCSAIYRKQHWEQIGGYDSNLIHGLEDWDFWLSLLKNGGTVARLDFVGFFYRVKEISMSTQLRQQSEQIINSQDYIYHKHKLFYDTEFGTYIEVLRNLKTTAAENDRYLKFMNTPVISRLLQLHKYLSKS